MLELSTMLSLGEWAYKLLEQRERRHRAYYEEIVKPCFAAAKDVRDDLVSICQEVERAILTNRTPPEIELIMLDRRRARLGTRDALRAQLKHVPSAKLTVFETAIFALLEGGHTHALMGLHVHVRHSLQRIDDLQQRGACAKTLAFERSALLSAVKQARQRAEDAWREIADGHAVYVSKYVGHT